MSKLLRFIGRAAFAPAFIVGGKNAIDNAESLAPVIDERRKALGLEDLPLTSTQLVQANGLAMIGLGGTLGLGILPRLSSAGLASSLTLTTLAAHRFWEEKEPEAKNKELMSFVLNTAIVGGLLNVFAAPSSAHKLIARREARRAAKAEVKAAKAESKAKFESARAAGYKKANEVGAKTTIKANKAGLKAAKKANEAGLHAAKKVNNAGINAVKKVVEH